MQSLVVWNNTIYAKKIADFFGKDFVITDSEALSETAKNLDKYSFLIVLCELTWTLDSETKNSQNLYGVDLAQDFRRKGVNLPIIFTSFLSRKQILKQHAQSEILKFVGHDFVQLPACPHVFKNTADRFIDEETKKIKKLSPLELRDVQLFACNPEGIVNAKVHQIPYLSEKLNKYGSGFVKNELENCIVDMYAAFQENYSSFLSAFQNKFSEIDKENVEEAIDVVTDQAKKMINEFKRKTGETIASTEKKPWQILLLDDELNKHSKIVKALEENGVKVHCTPTANEAFKLLEKDVTLRSKITVIITDYRLFEQAEDDVEVQQKMQGYTFLQEVERKFYSRIITAVIYSGMARQFLLDNLNSFKLKTEKYSKQDFKPSDPGAINYLVSRIIELGDYNYKTLLAFPLGNEGWKNHLHPYYLQYRNLPDYENRERVVSDYCKQWLEQFRNNQNPPTPMIKGDAFGAKQKEKTEQTIERFIAYYKTRRIAIYLYLHFEYIRKKDTRREVAAILMPTYKPDTKEARIKGFYSQVLGLSLTEFPFGATFEELNWFEYDLGIKVLDDYSRYRVRMNEMENNVGNFIADDKSLTNILRQNNFTLKSEHTGTLIFNAETFNPYFFDKMDVGFCIDWLTELMVKMNKAGTEEFIQLINNLIKYWKYENAEK